MKSIKDFLSNLNKKRKEKLPSKYVSRKKYEQLSEKYNALVEGISNPPNQLTKTAELRCLISPQFDNELQELCLFVSYSDKPCIKPHVAHHIRHLTNAKIKTILIINTNDIGHPPTNLEYSKNLSGLYLRENIGFDFGAWSHIYTKIKENSNIRRLYFINDSITGPLSESMFNDMILKIRSSNADVVGLTSNEEPFFHLQSFFLAIGSRILKDIQMQSHLMSLWQLPNKQMVIDFYETRLTKFFEKNNYSSEVIFPTHDLNNSKTDSTRHFAETLITRGFPYIKTSILEEPAGKNILKKFPFVSSFTR
jgi:lipopolysaccharide biosynthesis protein